MLFAVEVPEADERVVDFFVDELSLADVLPEGLAADVPAFFVVDVASWVDSSAEEAVSVVFSEAAAAAEVVRRRGASDLAGAGSPAFPPPSPAGARDEEGCVLSSVSAVLWIRAPRPRPRPPRRVFFTRPPEVKRVSDSLEGGDPRSHATVVVRTLLLKPPSAGPLGVTGSRSSVARCAPPADHRSSGHCRRFHVKRLRRGSSSPLTRSSGPFPPSSRPLPTILRSPAGESVYAGTHRHQCQTPPRGFLIHGRPGLSSRPRRDEPRRTPGLPH